MKYTEVPLEIYVSPISEKIQLSKAHVPVLTGGKQ